MTTKAIGDRSRDDPAATAAFALAAIVLGVGAAAWNPNPATVASAIALAAVAAAMVLGAREGAPHIPMRITIEMLLVGVIAEIVVRIMLPEVSGALYIVCIAAAGALGVAAILLRRFRALLLVGSLLLQTLCMCWAISATPATDIDVYWFGQLGSQALLDGQNPYALEYPNIYGAGTPLYAPELQKGDDLAFGYPYPPLSLLLGLPGYLVAGDFRYVAVLAVAITAWLAYLARPGAMAAAAALLLMSSPLVLQVLLKGWIEPFVGLAFAAAAFTATRIPRLFPYFLGMAVVIKQYMAPLWLLVLLLLPSQGRTGRKFLAVMPLVVAAVIVLPFLIWSPRDFVFDVVILQALQPFREDAVSFPGILARVGGPQLPTWLAFLAAGVAMVIAGRYARQTVAGLSGAAAFVFLVFFFFSKQAFMNYYFFTFVLLIFAVALAEFDPPNPGQSQHPVAGKAGSIA